MTKKITTPITTTTSLSECGFSENALAALSKLGLGPQAAVGALAAVDAEKAHADGFTMKVLREFRSAALVAGIDLTNAAALDRKPRVTFADGDTITLPSEVRVVNLGLDGDNTAVTVEGDGRRFTFTIAATDAAMIGIRLGAKGTFAFCATPAGDPQR